MNLTGVERLVFRTGWEFFAIDTLAGNQCRGGEQKMKVGSLCSGYGGLELVLEEVFGKENVEVSWFAEIDLFCREIMHQRYPQASGYGDILIKDFANVPKVNIITAGFPCQDVSVAGYRAGLKEGTRTGLWLRIAEIINQVEPAFVFLENVSALRTAPAFRDGSERKALNLVLWDLAQMGFDARWSCVRGREAGLLIDGERIFILAHRGSPPASSERA